MNEGAMLKIGARVRLRWFLCTATIIGYMDDFGFMYQVQIDEMSWKVLWVGSDELEPLKLKVGIYRIPTPW